MRVLFIALFLLCGCSPSTPEQGESAARASDDTELFTEISEETGLIFLHENGMTGKKYMVEMTGPGAALFDYDNDGDLDVYITQGHLLGEADDPANRPTDRLFRNGLQVNDDGTRSLKFVDVTEESGIVGNGYGLGVATGDIDNDGWVDLFVSNFGTNQLWRNNGNGTFSDVTERIPNDRARWSTSACFVDFDRDGWLDLFVCNYTQLELNSARTCYAESGTIDYCGPQVYKPENDRLLRNRGDGTFEDASTSTRIGGDAGPALGVSCADFNGDHWPDIYVANDGADNHLWINKQDGTFENLAQLNGCAANNMGAAEASMGVDAGDFDNDGDEDLFMTHLRNEKNTLYVNDGTGLFTDQSAQMNLDGPSRPYTAFGTAWFDYDNDGWLDLFCANGAVKVIEEQHKQGDPFPYHQPNQLFRNQGDGSFEETTSGTAFQESAVSRGTAFGDIDNDGDTDLLILNNQGQARLLRNNVGQNNNWIGIRCIGHNRDLIGAKISVYRPGKPVLGRRVRVGASYCAANDARVLLGLGDSSEIEKIKIRWPDGSSTTTEQLDTNRYHTLVMP